MAHWLLFYEAGDDYAERRQPFRADHLERVRAAHTRGDLLLAGALADPVDGSVLVWVGDTPAAAEEFARTDPYVVNGVVTSWRVRGWTVVVGEGATPV